MTRRWAHFSWVVRGLHYEDKWEKGRGTAGAKGLWWSQAWCVNSEEVGGRVRDSARGHGERVPRGEQDGKQL